MNLGDEDIDGREGIVASAKRKRVSQNFTSDDESSCDDRSPNSTLMKRTSQIFTSDDDDDDDETGRDDKAPISTLMRSRRESVDKIKEYASRRSLESAKTKRAGKISYGEDEPIDANDLKATLDKIGRRNVSNVKWDFRESMLADFGKNPELCMRAVCALYRQQTADEKAFKITKYLNGRGFSQDDALRGCVLAEFLTDGSLDCDLNKTVEELKKHNFEWIELCKVLATKYSRQLFKIYWNKEDPYFLPE